MTPRIILRFGACAALLFLPALGCSTSGDSTGGAGTAATGSAGTGAAGTSATGAAGTSATGTAGTSATGAAGTSATGSAGTSATGVAGTTGGAGTGATGAAGTTGGAGTGAAGTGAAGTGTAPGGIEVVDLTTPGMSTGCGKAPVLTGSQNTSAQGTAMTIVKKAASFTAKDGTTKMGEYIIALPNNYNMATPYKLAFGMGGYTRDALDCLYGDCWGFASAGHKANAVIVIITQTNPGVLHPPQTGDPNNAPVKTGWDATNEIENNVALFKAVKADVLATTCIDTKRVFVAGGSSGGIFAQYLGCWLGDELRGIASVGGCQGNTLQPQPIGTSPQPTYMRGQEGPENVCLRTLDLKNCKGNVGVVMVHGFKDIHILWSDARITHGAWVPKNGCGAGATTPMTLDQVHTYTTAGANRIMCVDSPGCNGDYPVRWCEHSEGGYDGSTHGWPSGQIGNSDGAGKYIWDFWTSLK